MNVHYSVILLREWLLPHRLSVVVLLVLWRAIKGVRHRGEEGEKTRNVDKVSDNTLVAIYSRTASELKTNFVTSTYIVYLQLPVFHITAPLSEYCFNLLCSGATHDNVISKCTTGIDRLFPSPTHP